MSTITFRNKKSFPLVQVRSFNSLPWQVVKCIDMLTLDPKYPPNIVGSYKYVVHEYPNDIDLFEFYQGCCGFDEVKERVVARFKEILKQIQEAEHTYLGDFKAGLDKRYDVNIGKMIGSKIQDYDPERIKEDMRKLHDEKLLTDDEIKVWLRCVVPKPSILEYINLKELVHNKCVVRWTQQDIEQGYKKLQKGNLISFDEAISQQSIVKIDIWTNISGRYIEITNWYAITYLEDGSSSPKYMSSPIDDYEMSLQRDLSYYKNPKLKKAMKYAKRLWNYYVLKNMKNEMITLYPLFSSGAAKMYQIIGEIETITNILENVSKPEIDGIKSNIEDWKTRLGTLLSDVLPTEVAAKIFVKVNDALDSRGKQHIIDQISDIKEMLEIAVYKSTKKFFRRHNISY